MLFKVRSENATNNTIHSFVLSLDVASFALFNPDMLVLPQKLFHVLERIANALTVIGLVFAILFQKIERLLNLNPQIQCYNFPMPLMYKTVNIVLPHPNIIPKRGRFLLFSHFYITGITVSAL